MSLARNDDRSPLTQVHHAAAGNPMHDRDDVPYNDLYHPLIIGDVRLDNNLVLSPMAGFSDLPFRALCRRHGAGLVCTEMVAAHSVNHDGMQASRRMRTQAEERPVSIQVFGDDPDAVREATRRVEADCEIVGFNMGCPAPQIRRAGCGAALLDHPERALELVAAVREGTTKPVLAKMRLGVREVMDTIDFARGLESVGADAIIVHGRTAEQGYSGTADWHEVRRIKDAIGIPVLVNGDVTDGPSARAALETSGADGIAIGRASLGDPRVFDRIRRHLALGMVLPEPTAQDRLADFLYYAERAPSCGILLPQIVNQAQKFTKGLSGAKRIRPLLHGVRTVDELIAGLRAVFEVAPQQATTRAAAEGQGVRAAG